MIDAVLVTLGRELLAPALVLGFAVIGVAAACLLWGFCALVFEMTRGLRRERGGGESGDGEFTDGGVEPGEAFGPGRVERAARHVA